MIRATQSMAFAAGAASGALLVCLSVLFSSHPGQPPACETPAHVVAVSAR